MQPVDDAARRDAQEPEPIVECLPVGMLETNCYLVTCPTTRQTLIIDPGAEHQRILERIRALGVPVSGILHTHGHFDHVGDTEAVLAGLAEPVPLAAHAADAYLYERAAREAGAPLGYGAPERLARPDTLLSDGDEVQVGTLRLRVIHTPGHTPGSISLLCGHTLLTGDTLFQRGIGRTDLPGGDEDAIYESIVTRLYTLPDDVRVYPGHGAATTIGEERRGNPFVRG